MFLVTEAALHHHQVLVVAGVVLHRIDGQQVQDVVHVSRRSVRNLIAEILLHIGSVCLHFIAVSEGIRGLRMPAFDRGEAHEHAVEQVRSRCGVVEDDLP